MNIAMIVAASTNNAIGKNNRLLWHLPNDLRFFKNTTWGFPVIMGRKSFDAVGKPLPGRINIVITRQEGWKADNVITATSLEDALAKASATQCKQLFIIGGGEIYQQSMHLADAIYLTRVHAVLEGDAFFPELDDSKWELEFSDDFKADEKHLFDYSFQCWKARSRD